MLAKPFALAVLLVLACSCGDTGVTTSGRLLHTVDRGDLRITVRERAELQARSDTRVVSQLEGRNTLIHLIPEGSVVEKGQKLAELDASDIEERRAIQAITVAKADAAVKQARKNFEVLEKELLASERTAASRLQIARIRLEKFLGQPGKDPPVDGGLASGTNREMVSRLRELTRSEGFDELVQDSTSSGLVDGLLELLQAENAVDLQMGEMANQILAQIDEISLARADLALGADTLSYSEKLAKKGFVSRNELKRDRINHRRQLSRVTVAWNNLQLLIKFTLQESLIALEQEVVNAELDLASVRAANEARRVMQESVLASSEAEYVLAKERLENCDRQVANTILYAPTGGLVVYGREDWDEPVYEGMEVRQRQDIIILPDIRTMVAELAVHEAQIDRVGAGQKATVKVDAFPDRSFVGHVSMVSTLPNPTRHSDDVKVYRVVVVLDLDNSAGMIRPGMNATVEIAVGVLRDVLAVPLVALESLGDRHFVWKATPDGPVATAVRLGANSLTHVEVLAGLQEGDRIHLVRPTGARLPQLDDRDTAAPRDGGNAPGKDSPVEASAKTDTVRPADGVPR